MILRISRQTIRKGLRKPKVFVKRIEKKDIRSAKEFSRSRACARGWKQKKYTMEQLTNKMDDIKMASRRCLNCGAFHQVEHCPYRDKGMRCFRCNEFGHIGKHCQSKRTTELGNKPDVDVEEEPEEVSHRIIDAGFHLSSWKLQWTHGQVMIKAIICTGTKSSFLRQSKLRELEYAPTRMQSPTMELLFGREIRTLGSYELHLVNNDDAYYVECHIVQDEWLPEDMILGVSFVKNVEITIRRGEVTFKRAELVDNEKQSDVSEDDTVTHQYGKTHKSELSEGRQLLQDGRVGSGTVASAKSE